MIKLEAGSGAVTGRMLSGALLFDSHAEVFAGVQSPGALVCWWTEVELVGCHNKVPEVNFTPSFLWKELSVMMVGEP